MKKELTLLIMAALSLTLGSVSFAAESAMSFKTGEIKTSVKPESTQEGHESPTSSDLDNSTFLVEDACNSDPGQALHTQTFQALSDQSYLYTFTETTAVFSSRHQISFAVPYLQTPQQPGTPTASGVGDMSFNYRFQLLDQNNIFVAPRVAVLFPTGDPTQGLGNGATGYQFNLPMTIKRFKHWVTNWNLGLTYTPQRKYSATQQLSSVATNFGASLVWIYRHNLNFLLELSGNTDQYPDAQNHLSNQTTTFINPGAAYAMNFKSGLQLNPGIGFPIGVASASGNYGIFTYLSLSHPLF